MRIIMESFGCKMNFLDAENLASKLSKMGFEIVHDKGQADYAIVNTCTVTDTADKKSFSCARNLQKHVQKVLIMGCAVKVPHAEMKDMLICPQESDVLDFFAPLAGDAEREFHSSRTRAVVAIQNGCDTYCSFCIIPFARGGSSSRPLEDIIAEIKVLEEQGVQEIVLTGINLAAWGASNTNRPAESRFAYLLEQILEQTTMPRVRISSVGSAFLHDDFFDVFADKRICDHLHISIQSGSERILQEMNRGHGLKEIIRVAEMAKQVRPQVALTSDFIVGFPTETEEDFIDSMKLAEDLGLAKLHVFPYSIRQGTVAEKMPQVAEEVKMERAKRLKKLGAKLRRQFIESQWGTTRSVLFEHKGSGLTKNYVRVFAEGVQENEIRTIQLEEGNTE